MKDKIALIGSGAWGTALACLAAEGDRPVVIYAREQEVIDDINLRRENTIYLPGVSLNANISAKHLDDLRTCDAGHVIWTVPTQYTRATALKYKSVLDGKNIINASKGIEIDTGKLVLDALEDVLDASFSILSGPSFAIEVAEKRPTTVSIGSKDIELAKWWQKELSTNYFRGYVSSDVAGLEVGGALKNVIAVAAGICDGLGCGYNARAALITRGLAEIIRFGVLYGAQRDTFQGLSGIGDLVLTTTADNSRNRKTGLSLAAGKTFAELSAGSKTVAEGVYTSKAAYLMAQRNNVSMPITTEVYKIIFENKDVKESVQDLLLRPSNKEELE